MRLARAWLVLASLGCAAAVTVPWALRLAVIGALWGLGLPAVRRAIDLAGPLAVRTLVPQVRGLWRVTLADGAQWDAEPHAGSASLGDIVWLAFRGPAGRLTACVIDRSSTGPVEGSRLRATLRAGRSARAGSLN
jgi:hypothetical protein